MWQPHDAGRPDRQISRDFFANRNVITVGQVAVLSTHIPAPGTVTLLVLVLVLGLSGLAAVRLRRRTV